MTTTQLYNELNYVNRSREKRLYYANLILADLSLIPKLLEVLFMVDDKLSPKAAWVFEFICNENIEIIIPHLETFTAHMGKVHQDSAVRPVAKICEFIAKAYTSNKENRIKNSLTETHKERIIETCFDYLINNEKIAPKAYSMNTLFLLGKAYDWVLPELALVLERDFQMQSSGFKARARHILKKIKKNNR
ncbi:adenylosuccinate lyase [Flavisericum labens]|uniref:adenylosuccinate lyase n=1 Tax=Flavisericum labens TaxID=3377112 RepID=UPI00387AA2FE